jgi:predicted adenylyl cyclase CyaB
MNIEVEVKAKVRNLVALKRKLKNLGVKYIGQTHHIDTYFLVAPRKDRYKKGYPLIRVREDKTKNKDFWEFHRILDFYSAEEYEVEIDNPKTAKIILKSLGYKMGGVVDKKRERYKFGQLNIELDQVKGAGRFIEVEIMNDQKKNSLKKIYNFLEKVGIKEQDIIKDLRYLDIIWEKAKKKKR